MPPAPIEPSGSIKFDDQTFLISYFAEINRDFPTPSSFTNCYKLNNTITTPMAELIAIFNGTVDLSSFLNFNTHQYSALIPRVRLYRVEYDESGAKKADKEFIFNKNKDYNFEITDILSTPKRNNSGIKRINWRLAGSNPVTAEKQVEVEIEFYFDSISSFSSGDFDTLRSAWANATNSYDPALFSPQFDTDTTTTNYWSLLFHPRIKEDDISTSKNRYNSKFYRIRANVGWEEVESNIKNQIFNDVDVNEEIRKLNYSFLLNLTEHKFNFNEDGSLTLTATYFAQFENATHNYDFNLLGTLKRDLEIMKSTGIGSLYDQYVVGTRNYTDAWLNVMANPTTSIFVNSDPLATESIYMDLLNLPTFDTLSEEEKSNLMKSIKDLSLNDLNEIIKVYNDPKTIKCLTTNGITISAEGVTETLGASLPLSSSQNLVTQAFSEVTDTLTDRVNKIVEIASERKKQKYYKKFFEKLFDKSNMQTIKITRQQKELWDKWINKIGVEPTPPYQIITGTKTTALGATIDLSALGQSREDAFLEASGKGLVGEIDGFIGSLIDAIAGRSSDDSGGYLRAEAPSSGGPTVTETLTNAGTEFGSTSLFNLRESNDYKYITFVRVGHIIEAAYEIIEDSLKSQFKYAEIQDLKRQIILCGNISNDTKILGATESAFDTSFRTGGRNLLDIPIDVKLLKLFLIENIVKPQKDTYSLFNFIKDIINKLVSGALNGSNLYNSQTQAYADVTLSTTIFSLGDANRFIEPMVYLNPLLILNDKPTFKNSIKNNYINNINTHSNYYNYFLIYDKKFVDFNPTNNREIDKNMGIYHFTVGEDVGLLKSANFSRIDTPYLKEAKAVGKQTFYLGQFRDRYNVSLTMVGNNIYHPGMMLYIQPSVEAVQTNSAVDASFAQITGIGGYYFVEKVDSTISEEGYETKLDCIWQYDGSEKIEETINGAEKCDIVFNNSRTKEFFSTLLIKATNQAILKKKEEANN